MRCGNSVSVALCIWLSHADQAVIDVLVVDLYRFQPSSV